MRDLDADALEAAARSIWSVSFENAKDDNAWQSIAEETREGVREEARRAITAYLSSREAKGWREMPREPTAVMETFGTEAWLVERGMEEKAAVTWRAMWDEAAHDAAAGGGDG